ncbi:YdcF family protein [Marivita geojedonensis]|uniref:DUF218 domain-containing protein n=1 Tax=Marivita geojedonensis TaxID=1123756 RepID=A0A1X4NR88_9RHOB|nr:YdcF family protein [Marivita geojedonensis]OSQ53502.1 hypothetical protein MGEO_02965 [Marivita geojedonensis]PRY81493.1 uncharacterized SAM-binding protein YcdF (DUF218 family) [Marivita geojedonensis]
MDSLFFVLSKLVWLLIQPESWLTVLLGLTLWGLHRQSFLVARRFVLCALSLVLIIGIVPIGAILIRPLEVRFPAAPDISYPAAIIVLGGGEDARMSAVSGLPELNDAGERLLLGAALAKQHGDAKLIFTGGSASLIDQSVSGADGAQTLFDAFGVSRERVVLEPKARNTAENASLTRALVDDITAGPWVLVTSAFHMPRSVGAFCAAGWRNIVPYPVDYRAADRPGLGWSFAANLKLLNVAAKEWIGLVVYRVTGRTTEVMPRSC